MKPGEQPGPNRAQCGKATWSGDVVFDSPGGKTKVFHARCIGEIASTATEALGTALLGEIVTKTTLSAYVRCASALGVSGN